MSVFERCALIVSFALAGGVVLLAATAPIDRATAVPVPRLSMEMPTADFGELPGFETAARAPGPTEPVTTDSLFDAFQRAGYDLQAVLNGKSHVPRILLASLPADLREVRETAVRKAAFFQAILPLVLQVNEDILADRKRIWRLRTERRLGHRLAAADRLWLAMIGELYGVARDDLDGLLRRVDIVPPSLALAQAAEESGWGTSRFVREGNAIFGQYTFSKRSGLLPLRRDPGQLHRIRAFDSLLESVRAYTLNLNTHRAYRTFRNGRADYRRRGQAIDGMALARSLTAYSERGPAYVESIRTIIRANGLETLDVVKLSLSEHDPTT
jgi:Bax protein